ncbi:MAG: pyridoxamine 5'-phosphate oxidase [Balneolaceae bacterium]
MIEQEIQKLRLDYSKHSLDVTDVDKNPFEQFKIWFKEALDSNVMEPNALTLATVDEQNQPQTRIVLLKGLEGDKFKFYTNYASDKGNDIEINNKVSICFFWIELERQVKINGIAEKLPFAESEAYFKSRPHMSQIGAHASNQSTEVPNREYLDNQFQKMFSSYEEGKVPKPETWGGYGITPTYFEYWQGRPSRLHDRIVYEKLGSEWKIKRLSP